MVLTTGRKTIIVTLALAAIPLFFQVHNFSVCFLDVLPDSGIKFRHHFFRREQGENYRMNQYDHGSGVLVADVNGDGLMDIYRLDFLGPNALYINKGNFQFEDVAQKASVEMPESVSVGGAFGDYDNNGTADLYVTTYQTGNRLFKNRGDGTFEDVTQKAGVANVGHSSAAIWFDYDLDGYLAQAQTLAFKTADAKAHYQNAVRLIEKAAWAGAVLELNRARALEPSNPEILIELGIALGELNQWNPAIQSLKKAIAFAPDSARAHYNLGVTLDRGNPGKQLGTGEYRKALRLNPKDSGSLINLATNIGDENSEEAKQLLLKALALEPRNAKAHFNLGLLLKNEGNSKGAVDSLQQAIASDPEPVEPRRHLVNLLVAQERWDEVLAQCQEILKRNPEDWSTRYTLAQTLIRQGKTDEGRTELQKSQDIRQAQEKQEEVKKLIETAVSQLTKGDTENGIKTLNSAIEINPDSAQAHMYLGVALASKGNTAEGIVALNRALTLDPSSARAHLNLGTVLMQTGQVPAARQEFEKALELDPYFSEAHNNFGLILSGEGQVPKAIDHFRIASELNPKYLEAVFNLGLALRSAQRIDDALQAFRRAAELAPNSPQVQFALGMTLKDKGNLEESKKALDRAQALSEAKSPSPQKQ